jgi:hypothetical protein
MPQEAHKGTGKPGIWKVRSMRARNKQVKRKRNEARKLKRGGGKKIIKRQTGNVQYKERESSR